MASETPQRRSFNLSRYLARGVLLFGGVGVGLGVAYQRGFLDGYFVSLPLVVLFYALLGLGSGVLSRKMLQSASTRVSSRLLLLSMVRLLLAVAVTALGLWLLPSHKWSFLLLSLICYLAAMYEALVPVLRR